jgi:HK97 gp10 family phage protein
MASPFTIELVGFDATLKRMKAMGVNVSGEVSKEISASSENIALDAARRAPVSDGFLRRSITSKKEGRLSYSVIAGVFYAPYVEFGTKKYVDVPTGLEAYAAQFRGKRKGDFGDLVLAIYKWVRKNGIGGIGIRQLKSGKRKGQFRKISRRAQDDQYIIIARAIAYVIAKKGIKPNPFMWPAFLKEKPNLIKNITEVVKKKR